MRREVHTEIDIECDPASLWTVITDFARYPEWNPVLPKVRGRAEPGSVVWFRFHLRWPIRMIFRARVVNVETDRELRWVGVLLFAALFRGEHYFTLQPLGDGQTRFLHGEKLSGALMLLTWPLIGSSMRRAYAEMNLALQERVESVGRSATPSA